MLDHQNAMVNKVVKYAGAHVPYYRKLFNETGLDLSNFRGLEDLENIPLLDKETLRNDSQSFLSDKIEKLGVIFVNTSNSTGTPLRVAQCRYSRAAKHAASLRAMQWGGVQTWL